MMFAKRRVSMSLAAMLIASSCGNATGDGDSSATANANEGEIVGTLNGVEHRWQIDASKSHWRKHEGSAYAGSVSIYGAADDGDQLPSGSALMIGLGLGKTADSYEATVAEVTITGNDGNHSSNNYGKVELRISSAIEADGELQLIGGFDAVMPFKKRGDRLPDQDNTMTIENAAFNVSLSHTR